MQTHVPGLPPIELPAFYPEFAWYYPDCEPETKAWFVSQARPDWVYFDCGANIGYYSILFAKLSPAGGVHAFEPTSTADLLATNLQHHALKHVHIHRLALGDRSGRRTEDIHRLWGHGAERKDYDFATLDEMVQELGLSRLDCIKIDVDSYDFEVLRGAEQTLARFDPWVVIELSESLALRNTSRGEVFAWLQTRGYTTAAILDRENYLLKRSASREPGQIPLEFLGWATGQGLAAVIKRELGRAGCLPAWVRPDYAATTLAEYCRDRVWVDSCREGFRECATSPTWQLFQYACLVRRFAPETVVELGGWNGDITRALVAGMLGTDSPAMRLISFKTNLDGPGLMRSLPNSIALNRPDRLRVELHAHAPAESHAREVGQSGGRILVLTNDPSPESSRFLLRLLLPSIAAQPHLIVASSISDGHYSVPPGYAERPGIYALKDAHSAREDLAALLDFTTRNQISFFSADRSLHALLGPDPQRLMQLESALGTLFSLQAHWRWFSLNERQGFPHFFP